MVISNTAMTGDSPLELTSSYAEMTYQRVGSGVQEPGAGQLRAAPPRKDSKIMIVDDDDLIVRCMCKQLEQFGHQQFVATTSGQEAVELAVKEQPDVVLLDIMMPDVDGLQILRTLRATPATRFTPVLILTAATDSETKQEALKLGATDFLGKPVDASELGLRVRNLVVVKAHYDQLQDYKVGLESEVARKDEQLVASRLEADQRYRAGKAEIAVEVLHNVGNALNSVNVSATMLQRILQQSHVGSLEKAVRLLYSHLNDPVTFFTQDERGKLLPEYLIELSAAFVAERHAFTHEIETLQKHVEHIRTVVTTQQRYAGVAGLVERVKLDELMDDSLRLSSFSGTESDTEIVKEYAELPDLMLDRQRLLQVFVNLIKNAEDSMQSAKRTNRRLVLKTWQADEQQLYIEVADNGMGIQASDLQSIFAHGYTTKSDGNGFGLHSCANLLAELGGTIQAFSDGVNQGAAFRVELPYAVAE